MCNRVIANILFVIPGFDKHAVIVKYLKTVVVGVGNMNITGSVDADTLGKVEIVITITFASP